GLAILVPLFIFTFGCILGAPYEEVVAYYGRPFPAIVAGLTLIVGLTHFRNGAQVMIEDYAHGLARKALIVGTVCLSYALMATGLFALIRLAL
ncbi:MAG: succinate dehydrogenase, hydrophobic membrane anchor protein, partial [Rhodobacteraceae bacterium]|nr:succinate dehydrogenase, hydrophobic membrane anchor protein [Paracoccaceae bacterium]MCB2137940.1 succinate dehydrogenase, hydrophobic membrane anchor protein [Paracoccaceae bacterium]MCB2152981.1 succinate dehydrogenase, hydrophobic membrane anchor protein [Paracoccaceae bacterium]